MEKAVSRRVTGRRPQLVKNAQSWRQQVRIEVDRFSPAAGAPESPSARKGDLACRERTAPCARQAAAFYRKGPALFGSLTEGIPGGGRGPPA